MVKGLDLGSTLDYGRVVHKKSLTLTGSFFLTDLFSFKDIQFPCNEFTKINFSTKFVILIVQFITR